MMKPPTDTPISIKLGALQMQKCKTLNYIIFYLKLFNYTEIDIEFNFDIYTSRLHFKIISKLNRTNKLE